MKIEIIKKINNEIENQKEDKMNVKKEKKGKPKMR